jgi:hypothetical protein
MEVIRTGEFVFDLLQDDACLLNVRHAFDPTRVVPRAKRPEAVPPERIAMAFEAAADHLERCHDWSSSVRLPKTGPYTSTTVARAMVALVGGERRYRRELPLFDRDLTCALNEFCEVLLSDWAENLFEDPFLVRLMAEIPEGDGYRQAFLAGFRGKSKSEGVELMTRILERLGGRSLPDAETFRILISTLSHGGTRAVVNMRTSCHGKPN